MSSPIFIIENTLAHDKKRQAAIHAAVDISATMYNCFFHAYALHLMANGQPFPEDLFIAHETDTSEVKALKSIVRSERDLSLFEDYDQITTGARQDHLAEKVLVLGALFRSWFIHRVKDNPKMKDLLFDGRDTVGITFYHLVESFDAGEDWLREQINASTNHYKANKVYFDTLHLNPISRSSAFSFWEKTGYDNYLRYLNQSWVKVFVHEVEFMLRFNDISYTIYNKMEACVSSESKAGGPHLELAIHAEYDHFYLIPNERTADFLEHYSAQHRRSLSERSDVLSLDGHDKVALAKKSPFLLLAVMLPTADLSGKTPLQVMIERLQELKSEIALRQDKPHPLGFFDAKKTLSKDLNHKTAPSASATAVHPLQPVSNRPPLATMESAVAPHALIPPVGSVMPSSSGRKKKRQRLTEQEKNYAYALYELEQKVLEFKVLSENGKRPKYQDAFNEIGALHKNLVTYWNDYNKSNKNEEAYDLFREQSLAEIARNKRRIEHHRGCGKIVTNLVLGVLGIGIFYFAVCALKWAITKQFFFKPRTDTANITETLVDNIGKLEARPEEPVDRGDEGYRLNT
ncbi:hypothetical protein [Legionella taurinensis]|uniref:Type IV secretion protein Dot n=1 Tax=Legionella taurinensis TaxID=70611 RepID=A0A3A5LJK3_9GAMM|nr:hypothetical protein [Legionella taurinensis]RJT48242.1 hypothetical protein D6J04_03855 [Legionella taurinensis]RJT69094.1 hypothetical protein D6J03_03360 [Legionella taurinensis]STY25986.1 Dot/Icm secretion system substrate [Legionella taurinensis]